MFVIAAVMIVSLMTGFWIGRSLRWKMAEGVDEPGEAEPTEFGFRKTPYAGEDSWQESFLQQQNRPQGEESPRGTSRTQSGEQPQEKRPLQELREPMTHEYGEERKRRHGEKVIPAGWAIGSPCAGEVSFFYEGSRRGAVIQAQQGLVYAPAAGKIVRLYPMGNAFLLRTEFGIELLMRIGEQRDELLSMYYRPRIVQNEIVNKGKLLLEYDLEGLKAQGVESSVSISVETAEDFRDILVTGQKYVRVGETVIWVKEKRKD